MFLHKIFKHQLITANQMLFRNSHKEIRLLTLLSFICREMFWESFQIYGFQLVINWVNKVQILMIALNFQKCVQQQLTLQNTGNVYLKKTSLNFKKNLIKNTLIFLKETVYMRTKLIFHKEYWVIYTETLEFKKFKNSF